MTIRLYPQTDSMKEDFYHQYSIYDSTGQVPVRYLYDVSHSRFKLGFKCKKRHCVKEKHGQFYITVEIPDNLFNILCEESTSELALVMLRNILINDPYISKLEWYEVQASEILER